MSPKARAERVYTFRLSAAKTAFQQIYAPNLVLQIASDTDQIHFYIYTTIGVMQRGPAHLIINVQRILRVSIDDILAWLNSRIALHWIHVSRWKSFVANRDGNKRVIIEHWRYVKGADNSADIISRGTTLQQLKDSESWWKGPQCKSLDRLVQKSKMTIIGQDCWTI